MLRGGHCTRASATNHWHLVFPQWNMREEDDATLRVAIANRKLKLAETFQIHSSEFLSIAFELHSFPLFAGGDAGTCLCSAEHGMLRSIRRYSPKRTFACCCFSSIVRYFLRHTYETGGIPYLTLTLSLPYVARKRRHSDFRG